MLKVIFSYFGTAFIWGSTRLVQIREGKESLKRCHAQGKGWEGYQGFSSANMLDHLQSFLGGSVQARGMACECHCHIACSHTLSLPAPAFSHRLSHTQGSHLIFSLTFMPHFPNSETPTSKAPHPASYHCHLPWPIGEHANTVIHTT